MSKPLDASAIARGECEHGSLRRKCAICERDDIIRELRGTLQELRIRLHNAGRRPEECYEMSMIDDALANS